MVRGEGTQVVIVGAGPVGVGLAIDLGRRGVACTIVEKRVGLSRIPKGQALTQRTMEHFRRWGIADEVRAARVMPPGYPTGMVTAFDSLASDFWEAPPARELVRDYYAEADERLPQYATEEVLRRYLATLPSVEGRFGWEATDVDQDDGGVRVRITDGAQDEILTAEYVVGCDGAGSLVRESSELARTGTDWDELVVLAVFRAPGLHAGLERLPPRGTYRVMRPDLKGYWIFFGRVDVGERFFFHAPVPRGTTRENLDVVAMLQDAAGFSFEVDVEHVGFWDLRVQVAQEYRAGRAFIAGDAAHTHPPYGGFGLNNGLEDARNLAWKLAAALQGWGGQALLDSYSLERQQVFNEVGEQIIGGWIRTDREFLETYDPQVDRASFEQGFAEIAREYGRRYASFEPHYDGSPVVLAPEGARTGAVGTHQFAARPGHHLAPHSLSSGGEVFDRLGSAFTLLAFDAPPDAVEGFVAAASRLGVPLQVVADGAAAGRERYGSSLVLVRPDEYVAWVGDAPPSDPSQVLRTVAGSG